MGRISKILTTTIIMAMLIMLILRGIMPENIGKFQYLRHLDYQVNMNQDGSMKVIETWDIDIIDTNTLVRNFNLSEDKFGNITNVEIIDLENGRKFVNTNRETYYVPNGEFYALKLNSSEFEIAFGIGMDIENGNRKFQISYTIEDVVTDYKDCQEVYWQFLAAGQNAIPAKKVTGKLTLPEPVSNSENLMIWGHGQLNGEIKKINDYQVEFEIDNLARGAMLEIRVVTKDKIFEMANRKVRGYEYLPKILEEEANWSKEANKTSQSVRILILILLAIYVLILIIRIKKIIELKKMSKQENDGIKKKELKYFREIPREETVTPAEATYLYKFDKTRLNVGKVQSNAVSATLLDLCYKKKIQLRADANQKVYIKIISDESGLKEDELKIFEMLENISENGKEFEIQELNKYAKDNYTEYSKTIIDFVNSARNSLYELGLIDKKEEKLYSKFENAESKKTMTKYIFIFLLVFSLVTQIPVIQIKILYSRGIYLGNIIMKCLAIALPFVLISMYYWNLQRKAKEKIAVLTQSGSDEKMQWKGLANYMKEYSLLDEKDILSLAIWEKYLIYATAFGIANEVIKQMKSKYPEVFIKEKWDDENMKENYPVIHFVLNPIYHTDDNSITYRAIENLGSGVSNAYRTSLSERASHSMSSGSGGGGGFSGGGGGRWRPVAGMGGR